MEQAYKEIAPRLVGLRDALDLSVEELAARTGVATDMVRQYESGEVEIPVGYLLSVSHACRVDLMVLITGAEPRLREYSVVHKGEGLSVDRRKDYDYKSLAYRFAGRKMEPFRIKVPPKEREQMNVVTHPGQEFIYLLEGRLEILLGDTYETLEPGDSLYFDSETPHALRGLDGQEAVFLDVIL